MTERIGKIWVEVQKGGLWIIIVLLIGVWIGLKGSESIYKQRINDAVKLGGMIHEGSVYDVKMRHIIGGN